MGLHIYSKYMSTYDSDYITAISIWYVILIEVNFI